MISHRTPLTSKTAQISITCDRERKKTSVAYVAICGSGCCCYIDAGLSYEIAGSDDYAIHRWSEACGLWQNPSMLILSRGLAVSYDRPHNLIISYFRANRCRMIPSIKYSEKIKIGISSQK